MQYEMPYVGSSEDVKSALHDMQDLMEFPELRTEEGPDPRVYPVPLCLTPPEMSRFASRAGDIRDIPREQVFAALKSKTKLAKLLSGFTDEVRPPLLLSSVF